MHTTLTYHAAMTACAFFATSVSAQSARAIRGPSPLVAIENEAPAKLIVDPPLPEQLALGLVFIPGHGWCADRSAPDPDPLSVSARGHCGSTSASDSGFSSSLSADS